MRPPSKCFWVSENIYQCKDIKSFSPLLCLWFIYFPIISLSLNLQYYGTELYTVNVCCSVVCCAMMYCIHNYCTLSYKFFFSSFILWPDKGNSQWPFHDWYRININVIAWPVYSILTLINAYYLCIQSNEQMIWYVMAPTVLLCQFWAS